MAGSTWWRLQATESSTAIHVGRATAIQRPNSPVCIFIGFCHCCQWYMFTLHCARSAQSGICRNNADRPSASRQIKSYLITATNKHICRDNTTRTSTLQSSHQVCKCAHLCIPHDCPAKNARTHAGSTPKPSSHNLKTCAITVPASPDSTLSTHTTYSTSCQLLWFAAAPATGTAAPSLELWALPHGRWNLDHCLGLLLAGGAAAAAAAVVSGPGVLGDTVRAPRRGCDCCAAAGAACMSTSTTGGGLSSRLTRCSPTDALASLPVALFSMPCASGSCTEHHGTLARAIQLIWHTFALWYSGCCCTLKISAQPASPLG